MRKLVYADPFLPYGGYYALRAMFLQYSTFIFIVLFSVEWLHHPRPQHALGSEYGVELVFGAFEFEFSGNSLYLLIFRLANSCSSMATTKC